MSTETEVKITPELQALIDAGDTVALNAQLDPKQPVRNDKGQFAPKVVAEPAKEEPKVEEEIVFKQEVELYPGKSIFITGASEAEVAAKAELVQTAAAAARAQVETKPPVVETPKPSMTADELFKIGTDLQAGKVEAIETYLEKSGALDRLLEKKGIKVADLKQTLEEKQTRTEAETWQQATNDFKSEHPDYVGTKRNQLLIGYKVAELKNADPNLSPKDAIEQAYLKCLDEELLDITAPEVANEDSGDNTQKTTSDPSTRTQAATSTTQKEVVVPKKKATSSTMFGTDGGSKSRPSTTVLTPKQIAEATKDMDGYEMARWYNAKVASGEIRPQ